jgi:hypothetical protein
LTGKLLTRSEGRYIFSPVFNPRPRRASTCWRKTATDEANEGLQLGLMFAVVNLVLDLLILVLLFKNGLGYFASLTVWLAYFILLIVPWLVGRSLARAKSR